MGILRDTKHLISANETGNSTIVLLGSGATFTGNWENVIDYTTVAASILGSTATDGTLYFDLSTDGGATFTSVPSTIGDATFAVPRIINVVESHIRIRYVNGSTAQTGTFNIQTKFSNGQQLSLLSSVDGFVNGETPTQVGKSVTVGKNPDGQYVNEVLDGTPSISVSETPLGISGTFDTGVLDCTGYTQIVGKLKSDTAGSITGYWCTDSAGLNVVREFTRPYDPSEGFAIFSSIIFTDYIRWIYTNGAIAQTTFYNSTGLQTKALSGQILGLEDFIPPVVISNVTRGVQVGKDPNGTYINTPASGTVGALTTNTPLGISGVWTSVWCPVKEYGEIKIAMVADEESSSCLLQLSHDGVTVHTSLSLPPQPIGLTGNYGFIHSLNPSLPYFRIVYTNGSVAQSLFEFTTTLLVTTGNGFISRATQVLDRYTDVKNSRVVNSPEQDRNFGLINYQQAKRNYGVNLVVGSSFELVAPDGSGIVVEPAIETIRVRSGGNVNDTNGGSGAQSIFIEGVDVNWNIVTEELVTAGASASAASATAFRGINKAYTKGTNTGIIIIENTTSNEVLAHIESGYGTTRQALYYVPANKTLWMTSLFPSVGEGDAADIQIEHIEDVSGVSTLHFEWGIQGFIGSSSIKRDTFLKFEEENIVYVEAKKVSGGGGGANVAFDFDFLLTDNI